MDWLTGLPVGVLVAGWLAVSVSLALVARPAVRALVPADEYDHVPHVAAPLMPALGAAFGILMGLTLASEATYMKSAQDIVANEAAGASRLAWAATSPGVEPAPIHAAMLDYLEATRAAEWSGDTSARAGGEAGVALSTLEHVVRDAAARPEVGSPAGTELLSSLDAMTSSRRDRIAASSRQIPMLYVATLIASGVALIVNAGALGLRSGVRTSLLVLGLAIVVGLSLALMFSLTAPWRGGLVVSGQPIDSVVRDLRTGYFG